MDFIFKETKESKNKQIESRLWPPIKWYMTQVRWRYHICSI